MGQALQPNRFGFTYLPAEIKEALLAAFWESRVLEEFLDCLDRKLISGFIANATEDGVSRKQRAAVEAWLDFCEKNWGAIAEQERGSVP